MIPARSPSLSGQTISVALLNHIVTQRHTPDDVAVATMVFIVQSSGRGTHWIAGPFSVLIVAAVIGTFVYRKRRESKTEEERSDVNPVYGTYEVHYDPVAEVAKARNQSVK